MAKKYLSSIRPNGIYEEPKLNNKKEDRLFDEDERRRRRK
jgi:hypothetical protein